MTKMALKKQGTLILILSILTTACAVEKKEGDSAGFSALSDVSGRYQVSLAACTENSVLDSAMREEAKEDVLDILYVEISKSHIQYIYPHPNSACDGILRSKISSASNTQFTADAPEVIFDGPECGSVSVSDKEAFRDSVEEELIKGTFSYRSASDLFLMIQNGSCLVLVKTE